MPTSNPVVAEPVTTTTPSQVPGSIVFRDICGTCGTRSLTNLTESCAACGETHPRAVQPGD